MFPKNFENIVKSNLSKNLHKILPKSFQNPFKILPKSSRIAPKSCPKSILDPKRVSKPSRTRSFRFFIDFLTLRGFQKSLKNRKNCVRDCFRTRLGSSIDFGHDFGAILVDFERILDGFWKDLEKILGRI